MAFGVFNKAFEFNESALRTTKGKGGQFQLFHRCTEHFILIRFGEC